MIHDPEIFSSSHQQLFYTMMYIYLVNICWNIKIFPSFLVEMIFHHVFSTVTSTHYPTLQHVGLGIPGTDGEGRIGSAPLRRRGVVCARSLEVMLMACLERVLFPGLALITDTTLPRCEHCRLTAGEYTESAEKILCSRAMGEVLLCIKKNLCSKIYRQNSSDEKLNTLWLYHHLVWYRWYQYSGPVTGWIRSRLQSSSHHYTFH